MFGRIFLLLTILIFNFLKYNLILEFDFYYPFQIKNYNDKVSIAASKELELLPSNYIVSITNCVYNFPIKGDEFRLDRKSFKVTFPRNFYINSEEQTLNIASNFNGSWIWLKKVFVSRFSTFSPDKNISYILDYHNLGKSLKKTKPGISKKSVKNLISISHLYNYIFGHWFIDTLCPLQLIPEDIQKKSFLLIYNIKPYIIETLHALGFSNDQFLVVKENEWVFAKNVYTNYYPFNYAHHFSNLTLKLINKLKSGLFIDNISATKFVLENRKNTSRRHISNFDELCNSVFISFPDYSWEIYLDNVNSITNLAKIYSTFRFLFSPCGSNLIGILFIQKGCTLVIQQDGYNDHSFMAFGIIAGCHIITYFEKGIDHFKTIEYNITIYYALKFIEIGLYYHKNKKWPDRIEYNY